MDKTMTVAWQPGWFVSERTLLVVRGSERLDFLNRMSTQALAQLKPQTPPLPAIFTDRQGRILSWCMVICQPEEVWLVCEQEDRRAQLQQWLEQHIIMEDVQLIAQDDFLQWHLQLQLPADAAPTLLTWLQAHAIQAKQYTLGASNWLGLPGKEIALVPIAQQAQLTTYLTEQGLLAWSSEQQERYRLQVGIPSPKLEYGQGVQPFEVRLDHHGLTWNKGCYVGQEVLSRLDSYDKVPRLLMGLHCQLPLLNTAYQVHSQDGTWLGRISSVLILPEQLTIGLAVVKRVYAMPSTVTLKAAQDDQAIPAQLEDRPFWQIPLAAKIKV